MILQFLLNYFLTEYGGGELKPVYELLEKNSFDIKKAIREIKPDMLIPLIRKFLSFSSNSTPPPNTGTPAVYSGVSPIENFADSEIIRSLNGYFSS